MDPIRPSFGLGEAVGQHNANRLAKLAGSDLKLRPAANITKIHCSSEASPRPQQDDPLHAGWRLLAYRCHGRGPSCMVLGSLGLLLGSSSDSSRFRETCVV